MISLPLRLRGKNVTLKIEAEPCGPSCLLGDPGTLQYALPAGLASQQYKDDGLLPAILFRSISGSIIKRKSAAAPTFGNAPGFSPGAHARALDVLRTARFGRAPLPLGECACSSEFSFIEGRTAWVASSAQAPRLAELYEVHRLDKKEDRVEFLKQAWDVVRSLNSLGITHGDPAAPNFLIGTAVSITDLDGTAYTGQAESLWDQNVFIYGTIVPVLGDLLPMDELSNFVQTLMNGTTLLRNQPAIYLRPALSHAIEYNRCARVARSTALRSAALRIQLHESQTKLTARLHQERESNTEMRRIAEDRAAALDAAHGEMEMLRNIARQRAEALERVHGQAQEAQKEIQNLRDIADERAQLIERIHREALERAAVSEATETEAVATVDEAGVHCNPGD